MTDSTEYMIEWKHPAGYDPSGILRKLPSSISRDMREIYNYSVKPEGFYPVDRHVQSAVVGHAMKFFLDEALSYADAVTVRKS